MKNFEGKVIVITGASSGIGRAAALQAAEGGASLVLIARKEEALAEVAAECEERGSEALVATADVTHSRDISELAQEAYNYFGHIDAWVNNAAVTLFAKFEEASPEEYRQVIETNLFGYINGARAVLPYFHEQGHGILINVSSVVGRVGSPYVSAYTTSKFAINGWSESLRMELGDTPGIRVCTVLAASIDTPLFQHAGNLTGRAVKPLPPVYPATMVADAILGCVRKPRPEVYAGPAGAILTGARILAPRLAEKMMAKQVEKEHFQEWPEPPTEGNLFEPAGELYQISGGWSEREPTGNSNGNVAFKITVLLTGIGIASYLLRRNQKGERQAPKKAQGTPNHRHDPVEEQVKVPER